MLFSFFNYHLLAKSTFLYLKHSTKSTAKLLKLQESIPQPCPQFLSFASPTVIIYTIHEGHHTSWWALCLPAAPTRHPRIERSLTPSKAKPVITSEQSSVGSARLYNPLWLRSLVIKNSVGLSCLKRTVSRLPVLGMMRSCRSVAVERAACRIAPGGACLPRAEELHACS